MNVRPRQQKQKHLADEILEKELFQIGEILLKKKQSGFAISCVNAKAIPANNSV